MRASRGYLLWNHLSRRFQAGTSFEESLGAYREALILRATYTRVIYNVGVVCKWNLPTVNDAK